MKTMDELYKQCKKLQIFIFSKKTEKIKSLKKKTAKKSALVPPFIHTTANITRGIYGECSNSIFYEI